MACTGAVRDGLMDAEAALHANLRRWERLAESGEVSPRAWRECMALILEGEAAALRRLREVAPISEAASARPRGRQVRVARPVARTKLCAMSA